MPSHLLGLSTGELADLARGMGEPAYRGRQIGDWLYRSGARGLDQMLNLPQALRLRLAQTADVGRARRIGTVRSKDGTVKLLLELGDGATIETVGLPYPDRTSCCVSTQVGCAVGCAFCATGMSGFARNLSAGEIVGQVLDIRDALGEAEGSPVRVDHVIFMGMGEPLFNYDATLKALTLLNTEMGIAARNLTVSTAGYVPGILKLAAEELQITLAISLHAPNDELRRRLMPGMARWTIADVLGASREYARRTNRRITFEYCLLDGVNDGEAEARQLAQLLRGLNCHVNLIPYNRVSDTGFRPSPAKRVAAFREELTAGGIQVTQRFERGADIDAACGQLRRRSTSQATITIRRQ